MSSSVQPTPTALTGRAIAPDLARGLMLLFIAVANAPWYLWGSASGTVSAHPPGATGWDLVAQTVAIVVIDARSYPMFAFLFGYGIWQLYRRQYEKGIPEQEARRLLRQRHLWLLAFGAVHALLLWMGDILGAYGLAGLVIAAAFLSRRDATIKLWAWILGGLVFLGGVSAVAGAVLIHAFVPPEYLEMGMGDFDVRFAAAESNYALSAAMRLGLWIFLTPAQLLAMIIPIAMLIALLAARAGVLEQPENHLPLLRRTAIIGIGIGWGFGALVALQNAGALGVPHFYDWAFMGLNSLAGLFGGLGYVAAFALIAARWRRRGTTGGPVGNALQALGKRSLSGYLAQSLIFAPLLCAWGFGLGAALSSWSILLLAVAVWLVTVLLAVVLEKAGKRGPAEWLLRRLAYPRPRP